jgi:hypothetical protein
MEIIAEDGLKNMNIAEYIFELKKWLAKSLFCLEESQLVFCCRSRDLGQPFHYFDISLQHVVSSSDNDR